MNCFGSSPPILVPDPPATITAYFFMAAKVGRPQKYRLFINGNFRHTIAVAHGPVHARAIKYHGRVSLCIYADHTAFSIQCNELLLHHYIHGLFQGIAFVLHQAAYVMRCHGPDKGFTMPGTADGA